MDHYHPPTIDTNIDVTGHAHPAPGLESPKDPLEAVHDLVLKVVIDVVLRQLLDNDISTACGPLMPRVRRSPLTANPVQHLDIVSCWKGLSHSQTLELATWEGVFKDSLASQLKYCLQQRFAQDLAGFQDPLNEALLVPRMLDCLQSGQPLTIPIAMTSLIHHMIARLFHDDQDSAHNKLVWSLSSGNLPSFVFNFIRTHDCIFDGSGQTQASFNISQSYSDGVFTIFAEVQWQLPKLTFAALPTSLLYGDMYRIIPQFDEPSAAITDTRGFSLHKTSIEFTVSKSPLPLQWDYDSKCFHAPIICKPKQSQCQTIETTVCAKISTLFHTGVRFERVSRYKIKLDVCQANILRPLSRHNSVDSVVCEACSGCRNSKDDTSRDDPVPREIPKCRSCTTVLSTHDTGSPWILSYTNTPQSKVGQQDSFGPQSTIVDSYHGRKSHLHEHAKAIDSVHGSPSEENCQSTLLHYSNHPRAWGYPSINGEPLAHAKRKASHSIDSNLDSHGRFALDKFEHLDLEVDVKRCKLKEGDCSDVHDVSLSASPLDDDVLHAHLMKMFTGRMGDVQTSPPVNEPCWFEKLDENRARTLPKSFTATLSDRKHTTFPWRKTPEAATCLPDPRPVSPEKSLSQNEIQRNYHEFEERTKRKLAEKAYYMATVPGFDGVVSPTDDDDKAFERVFLEGSEQGDWESDTGVLSDGMASVCMDDEL